MRFLSLSLLITAFVSCTNTKTTYHAGKPVIQSGNRMLITEIKGFSSMQASQMAEDAKERLIDDIFIVYLPEVEYDLLKAGLAYDSLYADNRSAETQKKIKNTLNVRYLLEVELLHAKNGSSYGYYTRNELAPHQEPFNRNDETNSASMLFKLIDLEQASSPRSFTVKVDISPLVLPDEDGEDRVNVTNEQTARFTAYRKGIKRIKKSIF